MPGERGGSSSSRRNPTLTTPRWPRRHGPGSCRTRPRAYVCGAAPASYPSVASLPEDIPLRFLAKVRAPITAGLIAAATATCSDNSVTGPGARLSVSAPSAILYVDDSEQLSASLASGGGAEGVVWRSSDSTIASVDAAGVVRGVRPGAVTITASAGRARGTAALTVHTFVKFGVRLSPTFDSLFVGQSRQLDPIVVDSLGNVRNGAAIVWSLSDSTLASISSAGVVRASGRGTVTVFAASGGLTGAVDIKVMRPVASVTFVSDTVDVALGTARTLYPLLRDSSGDPIIGRTAIWSSSDASTAAVDAQGAVQGLAAGVAEVGARIGTVSGSTHVRVVPHSVWRVTPHAPEPWLTVGRSEQLTVVLLDGNYQPTDHHAVRWMSGDTTRATVSSEGIVTALGPGPVTLTAESEGVTGAITIGVVRPVASLRFAVDSVVLPLGTTTTLYADARDSLGGAVGSELGTWTSSDSDVLVFNYPESRSTVFARALGRVTVTTTVDGHTATVPVIVVPLSSELLTLVYPDTSATAFSQYGLQLYLNSSFGGGLADRPVVVRTSDATVATVSPDSAVTDQYGQLGLTMTTSRPGRALLTVTAGATTRTYGLTVLPAAPSRVAIGDEPASPLAVGATHRLTAVAVDAQGRARAFPLRWRSLDASIASVSDSGIVTGALGGATAVVVTAGDTPSTAVADTATIIVRVPAAPSVAAISPAELMPGQSAVITGANFGADAAANVVTVDGVRATVTAATATQLTLTLPPPGSFSCSATRLASVVVSAGPGLVTATTWPLATAPQRALAPGESVILPAGARCFEMPRGDATYLLTTSNPASAAEARAASAVRGDTGTSAVTTAVATAVVASRVSASTVSRAASPADVLPIDVAAVHRAGIEHRHILDANRAVVRRNGAPGPLFAQARAAAVGNDSLRAMLATTAAPPTVGALSYMRVWAPDAEACGGYRTVQARTVYVGAAVTVAEDVNAPLARKMDDEYRKIGAEFESSVLPLIRANFGDPLAADAQLGLGGRVVLLFTPTVNAMGNVRGYVSGCDFYPRTVAPSSNQAAVFYAQVPTSGQSGFTTGTFTKDVWRHVIRATVVHETKHLASFSERLARGASVFEESWLEEASAMAAMEIWGRAFTGTSWKGRATYQSDLYCEVRPTTSGCVGHPYVMYDHFAFLYDYLSAAESHSPLGPTDYDDATFYGSGWALLRWSIDQYAGTESSLLRALTQETSLAGVANLEARTGHPFAEMSADWSTATALDVHYSYFQPTRAQLRLPSWNVGDVLRGMAQDFPQYFSAQTPSPLRGLYCGGLPVGAPAVSGGSSAFYELSTCANWKNFLDVTAPGGASIAVELVRIR